MKIAPHQRRAVLGTVLILTAIATSVSSDSEDAREVVQPVMKRSAAAREQGGVQRTPGVLARLDLSRLDRRADDGSTNDPFAPKSWYTPPPPPAASASVKPSAPVAPPLPFVYLGRMTDATGKIVIYLTRAERVFAVTPGETLDEQYRLETVSGSQLGFVYLPLNTRQTLDLPAQ